MFGLFWAEIVVARSTGMQRGAKAHCAAPLGLSGALSSCARGSAGGLRRSGTATGAISCRVYGCRGRRSRASAEPHCDAAIFSHDVETISGLFSRASILQQGASKGERASNDVILSDIATARQAGRIIRANR